MNNALVIARRELAEKKFVFLTAVAGAIIPFLTMLLPMARSWTRQGTVAMTASILATGLALGLALIGGASMIGRELAERRLSFYFARPVGSMSIWFGKFAAALFILLVAPAIVLAPALLFAGDQWRAFGGSQWEMIAALGLGSVLLLCVSHLISTFVRSRSVLVLVDFVLAAAVAFAIPLMVRPLLNGMALHTVNRLAWGLVIAFVLAVAVGGAWQVADGRTDRKRSHAALSRAFWAVMGVVLLGAAGYVAWVVSPKPSDIGMQLDYSSAKEGNWVFLSGQAPHRSDYFAGFAYDLGTGRYVRVSGPSLVFGGGSFTRDGKTAVLRERLLGRRAKSDVTLLRLGEDAQPIETGLMIDSWAPLVLSDDGRRIAYLDEGILSVYDLPSKRSLASVRFPVFGSLGMFFASPDAVRIYSRRNEQRGEQVLTIYELDVKARAVRKTGELRAPGDFGAFTVSADGSKLLFGAFSKADAETVVVADARTAQRIADVPRIEGGRTTGVALLADGTIFAPTSRGGQITARVLRSDGALIREIPLGAGDRAFVAAELTGNRIVVGTMSNVPAQARPKAFLLDVATGRILRTESLAIGSNDFGSDPRRGMPAAERLMPAMTKGTLVAWNPVTGETKHIATRVRETESRGDLLQRLTRK
jgi:ABC-type transport system involved in multi-copper enzyme maturation permease subunit